VFDRGDGTTAGVDGLLANLTRLNLIHHRMTERRVEMRSGVGTVSGTALLASASPAEAVIIRFPYSATYQRRGGVWRMMTLRMPLGAGP
jgi:hypothetical protein